LLLIILVAWKDRSIDCFIIKQFPCLVLETRRTPIVHEKRISGWGCAGHFRHGR
jgi:hypothetical protein